MTKRNEILLSPGFLTGLLLLLANDFVFKDQFHNALTGKLSDIAGLFIFPLFISVLLRSQSKLIFFGVAVFFIYWKSPLSDGLLNTASSLSGMSFTRVVDYTDLWCLAVLPFSYRYLQKEHHQFHLSKSLILLLSSFAFMATSQRKASFIEERILLDSNYKRVLPEKTYLIDVNRLSSPMAGNDRGLNVRYYDDTLHVFLNPDSIDRPLVFIFEELKNGKASLLKILVQKDATKDADQLFYMLETEISKREWEQKKQKDYNAKMDSLIKLTLFFHQDKRKEGELFLIDTVLKYATPALISEQQLYELKADILMSHYGSSYKTEILQLFDRQDSLDKAYNRNGYSVRRYSKRLDIYDKVREDSIKDASDQKQKNRKQ